MYSTEPPLGDRVLRNVQKGYEFNGILTLVGMVFVMTAGMLLLALCICASLRRRQMVTFSSWRMAFPLPVSSTHIERGGGGGGGLDPQSIESLPGFVYRLVLFKEKLECSICISELEHNEKGKRLPNCNHAFHAECIEMWLSSHPTCPVCRRTALPVEDGTATYQKGDAAIDVALEGDGDTVRDHSFVTARESFSSSLRRMLSPGRHHDNKSPPTLAATSAEGQSHSHQPHILSCILMF